MMSANGAYETSSRVRYSVAVWGEADIRVTVENDENTSDVQHFFLDPLLCFTSGIPN
jgi:hypothetical protein